MKCTQAQCDTMLGFVYPTKSSIQQPANLVLEITRYLGELKSPNDPVWLSQLIYPNLRLMTHNWSIGMAKLKAFQQLEYNKEIGKETEYSAFCVDENVYWDTQPSFSLVWADC